MPFPLRAILPILPNVIVGKFNLLEWFFAFSFSLSHFPHGVCAFMWTSSLFLSVIFWHLIVDAWEKHLLSECYTCIQIPLLIPWIRHCYSNSPVETTTTTATKAASAALMSAATIAVYVQQALCSTSTCYRIEPICLNMNFYFPSKIILTHWWCCCVCTVNRSATMLLKSLRVLQPWINTFCHRHNNINSSNGNSCQGRRH